MGKVIFGKPEVIRYCVVALLSGEHILLEDVPGVGKTLAGKAIAKSIAGKFARLQFTPDLLPSDITGSNVFNSTESQFVFNQGPVFNNIVLADEINRAPPRTQAALLEAMGDHQCSIDGKTYDLPRPFLVVATQNPFEYEGTYVLPESQLDRFLLRVSMGYPDLDFERDVLKSHRDGEPVDQLTPVLSTDDVIQLQQQVRQVKVEASLSDYMLDVVHRTRECPDLSVGVSTRGALLWYRAAQSYAFASGRDYVVPDDIKRLAIPVLSHRVLARGLVQGSQREVVEGIIDRLVSEAPVPS
ncbi:MAG: MoxR family ATPase [Planctomycetota bacterium]|nr:MoxR family ATPase [Planctomycetota bacterium]MEC7716693.1 MoxR family ATPase [Planctomycetota bacterium]MEC8241310.1 MoxR family ATPase [Planctomycetota bacterium]MEC8301832.1 MoxR family ATPase [Planctomycetota bacterium]MEC8304624.1 MoxR family ATPase [Planctomycetota bacterium]